MSRLQQRRASLPVLPSAPLLGVPAKPERGTRHKWSRLFSRHKGVHSNGFGLSSMESLPDCIPEDDIYENYAGSPPMFPLRPRSSTMSPLNASAESLGSGTSSEVDMSPLPGALDFNPLTAMQTKHRQRRGSLPAVGLSLSPNMQHISNGGVKKSRSMDKLFSKRPHKKAKLFSVSVHLPSGFVQEVEVCDGMSVRDVARSASMERGLGKYRLYVTSTRAVLDLSVDARLLGDSRVLTLEEEDEEWNESLEGDVRLHTLCQMCRTERRYQENLRSIFDVYAEPLRKFSSLSKEDHQVLFFGIEPILSISAMTLLKLEDAIRKWDSSETKIGNLYSKQFWFHYEEYCNNFLNILNLLKEKRDHDQEFFEFCKLRQGAGKYSLESLLFIPVQRIPNYEQYLNSILAETDPAHPDYDDLTKAVTKVRNMVKERQEELHVVENEHKVGNVQERFPNDDLQLRQQHVPSKKTLQSRRKSAPGGLLLRSLKVKHSSSSNDLSKIGTLLPDKTTPKAHIQASPNRIYVLEGPVQLSCGLQSQDRYLFLFNDLLLIAKQKTGTTFKLKTRIRVGEMWLSDCIELVSENSRSEETSFVLGWPTMNYVATFDTPDTKQAWLAKLKESISAEKEKEEPKSIMLRVLNRDLHNDPNGVQYKWMPVSHTEEASSLLQRCTDNFNLNKTPESEYQLWVRTGKDDPPYPLIGHEHPYSIKMNHARDTARADGPETPVIMDQDLNDNDVQFILRENKKIAKKGSFDENAKKKSVKSKKSPLSFWKKRARDPSPSPAPTGKLFGHALSEVWEENNEISKPIYDMLYYLFLHGPFTPGIFRKPANHKNMMELREKLDCGEDALLDDMNPMVIASVLKEYLRALPDCLLLHELYPMWVETVEMHNLNERLNNTKHVCLRLPSANVQLLRHLMCVLYHIQLRSDTNSMNAYNLAVCISQSLLWCSQSLDGQELMQQSESMAKIPRVVEYMIDNCIELFGEDCVKIFGEPPVNGKQRGDSSTDSDSINSILGPGSYQQPVHRRDDSSIDSLDHAFLTDQGDVEAGSPGLGESKHLSPTNFSCDSGLFSSDTQLYDENAENSGDVSISSRKGLHRSAPVSRAVSHESTPLEVQSPMTPQPFSDSYDSAVDMSGSSSSVKVIPPGPRKQKRSQSEGLSPNTKSVQRMPTVHSGVELRTNALQHIKSENAISDMKNVRAGPKRASGDSNLGSSLGSSLGSVDELSDDFRELQGKTRPETNILRKSESGAKLYIDDSILHSAMYIDPTVQHAMNFMNLDTAQCERPQSYHGTSAHVIKKKNNRSVSPPATRHSWGGQLDGTPKSKNNSNARFSLSPSHSLDDLNEELEDTREMSKSMSVLSTDSTLTDTTPVPSVQTTPSRNSSSSVQDISAPTSPRKLSPQHSKADPQVSQQTKRNRTPPLRDLKSKSMDHFPSEQFIDSNKDSSQQIKHSPRQMDKSLLKKHLKGMTATGGDLFPTQMRKKLQGHKTMPVQVVKHEPREHSADASMQSGKDAEQQQVTTAHHHKSKKPHTLRDRQANSLDLPDRDLSAPARLSQQSALEKSASDQRVSYHMRPHQPPSYQEAMRRKQQQLSEAEIEEQKKKSAMARKMHEKSMKMYTQEQRRMKDAYFSEPERSRDTTPVHHPSNERSSHKPLPSYEQAVKRAEELKEKRHSLPPPYSKPSPNKSENAIREFNLSGQSRRRSKSRERGQRLSDTRLESRRKRKSNLSRSKSDSSEHLNKLSNIKQTYSSSTDTDDDRPVVFRHRRIPKSLSKERLNHDTASPRGLSKSAERPKSVDYSRMLKDLADQGLDIVDDNKKDKSDRQRRKSWTVKNRDWHKELADKYTGPAKIPANHEHNRHAQPIFAYRGTVPQVSSESQDTPEAEEGEKPKRRWVKPIHPSKDLIMNNGEDAKRGSKDYSLNHVQRSSSHAASLNNQKNNYTPTHVLLEQQNNQQNNTDNAHLLQLNNTQCRNSDSPPSSTSEREDSDADFDSSGKLTWSVSKLRGLYDASKAKAEAAASQKQELSSSSTQEMAPSPRASAPVPPRAAPRAINAQKQAEHRAQPRQPLPRKDCIIITKEYTNPHAEKQYV